MQTYRNALRLAAGLAVILGLLQGSPAHADSPYDYGYTGGADPIRAPDSADHWQCQDNYPIQHALLNSAMDQLANQTDLNRFDASSCGPSTDVVWVEHDSSGAFYGKTVCARHAGWGVCDQFWVLIDQAVLFADAFIDAPANPAAYYQTNLTKVLRHELGHTAGLHHAEGLQAAFGAMNTGTIPLSSSQPWLHLAYMPFQIALINTQV